MFFLRTCTTTSQRVARTRWSRTCRASPSQAFPGGRSHPGEDGWTEHLWQELHQSLLNLIFNFPHFFFSPSRVPLSTLSISSDNVAAATSMASTTNTSSNVGAFALKLPGSASRHHSEPVLANSPSPRSSRKQNLGWKKPRMRKSWSE